MASVHFFSEDIPFKLGQPRKTSNWIKATVRAEGKSIYQLNFIFCSDEQLKGLNIQFLNHNSYTDILTFDSRESEEDDLNGDIFISIDRVRENSKKLKNKFEDELHRVIIHGVLHLLGYSDKSQSEKSKMRKKEEAYLSLRT